MALFGNPNAFLGIDIGTSHIKFVELLDRRRRIEVATYAQAKLVNPLLQPAGDNSSAVERVAGVLSRMIDQSSVSADTVVASLPSGIVFSSVISLPPLSDDEINKAVHFEAKEVVPAELDDMVLGWSRVGNDPHMDTDKPAPPAPAAPPGAEPTKTSQPASVPIFITAAPKDVVDRYMKVISLLGLQLKAIEVETFSLIRSLFGTPGGTGLIVDIGDRATTFNIVVQGTPRIAYTIEHGGYHITTHIAKTLGLSETEAEAQKVRFGLNKDAPADVHQAIQAGTNEIFQQGKRMLSLYRSRYQQEINRTILIGGGANLKNLADVWSNIVGTQTVVGNPWRGLTYPQALEPTLQELGPTFAVAVGLAQRGFNTI